MIINYTFNCLLIRVLCEQVNSERCHYRIVGQSGFSVLTCNRVWRELQVGTVVAWALLRRAAARAVLFMRRA